MATSDTEARTCVEDGSPLITVTMPERGVMAVCTTCGAAWKHEETAEYAAGLIPGRLSEEMLVKLREQIRLSRNKGG
jgi:hypothetical protein